MMELVNRMRISTYFIWRVLRKRPQNIYRQTNHLYSSVINPTKENCLIISSFQTNHVRYAKKHQGKMSKGGGKVKIVQLTDEEMSHVIDIEEYKNQLLLLKEKLKKDFVDNISLRSSSNIENIIVNINEEEYPLHELAQISRKNQNLIAINMIDFPEALKPAIKAITESGSDLNLQQDGTMLYLNIPKITREHRENLAKNAKSVFVKAKDEVRFVQNSFIKEAKRKTDLSEDLVFQASNQIKYIAEQAVTELEMILKVKQKELLGET